MLLHKIVLAACLVAHASEGVELLTKPGATVTSDLARLPPAIEFLGICVDAQRINLPRVGQDFPVPQYPQAPLDGGALPDQTLDALILDGSSPPPLPSCSHNRWSIDAQGLDALREQAIAFCPPWEMSRGKMPVVETQQGQLCQNTVPCLCDALPRMGKHLLKHGPTSLAWDCPSLHWNTSRSDV